MSLCRMKPLMPGVVKTTSELTIITVLTLILLNLQVSATNLVAD